MCECQALHPDPDDEDSDNDFEGEEYNVEEAGKDNRRTQPGKLYLKCFSYFIPIIFAEMQGFSHIYKIIRFFWININFQVID